MPKECAKCGKQVLWNGLVWEKQDSFPEFYGKFLCNSCTVDLQLSQGSDVPISEKPFKDADEQGKRIVTINDLVLSPDGIGKHLKIHTEAAGKYGYSLINMTQNPDQFCIYMALVFEKKEITPTKFVNCSYCKSHYDANKYFKCPNCGALLTA